MADIHIVRQHHLGLPQARTLALRWAEVAEKKLDMKCHYVEGETADVLKFNRPGASGHLKVAKDRFQLDARLGLLLGVFRSRIENEIVKNLDALLDHQDPLGAFEEGIARHEAKRAAKHAKAHAPARGSARKTK